jgi:lipopolysaccharide export system protein LptA
MREKRQMRRLVWGVATTLVVSMTLWGAAYAQPKAKSATDFRIKGWKLPIYDEERREEAKIFGEDGFQVEEGIYQIQTVHLETYEWSPDGTAQRTNLIIEAATCRWNLETRLAYSPDTITARTADGKFKTTGKGFQWSQYTGLLIITNGVRTTLIPPPTKEGEALSSAAQEPITITSLELLLDFVGLFEVRVIEIDQLGQLPTEGVGLVAVGKLSTGGAHIRVFDADGKRVVDGPDSEFSNQADDIAKLRKYLAQRSGGQPQSAEWKHSVRTSVAAATGHTLRGAGRFARYRRVVDVRHPSGAGLKSFDLNVSFEESDENRLEGKEALGVSEVIASGNVLIEGEFQEESVAVRGEKAIYSLSSASIRLPDNPTIQSGSNRLTGEVAIIDFADPENRILSVDGKVRMEAASPAPAAGGADKPDIKTVIQAESLEFAQKADSVVFAGSVTVERSDGVTLKSDWLSAVVDAENDRVGRIEARRNVVVEMTGAEGTAVAKSGSAIVDEANGLVILGKGDGAQPEIVQGGNVLRGDSIELDMKDLEDLRMKAIGNTHLIAVKLGEDFTTPVELKAAKFSYEGKILLAEGGAELKFSLPNEKSTKESRPLTARAEAIVVDQKLGIATLDKAVRIVDSEGVELTCRHLVVDLPELDAELTKLTDLTATGEVVMTTVKNGRTSRAKGDKAVYLAASGDLVLTGNCLLEVDGNQIFGDRIVSKLEREGEASLRAEGNARMEFAVVSKGEKKLFQATADAIVLDQESGTAQLLGNVQIENDAGLYIRCGKVDLEIPENPGESSEKPSFVASENVIARIPHESRIYDVKCDSAEYVSAEDSLELLGNIQGETPEGKIEATRFKYRFGSRSAKGKVGSFKVSLGKVMKNIEKEKEKEKQEKQLSRP